jgi:hypothetical protein
MIFVTVLAILTAAFALFSPPEAAKSPDLRDGFDVSSSPIGSSMVKFVDFNGNYDVTLSLSTVSSTNADTLSAAEALRGELFSGVLFLSVDETGIGTISIRQMFFTPKEIAVSPFSGKDGAVSGDTLYGFFTRSGMKLTVVCVCADEAVSGFIWLDSESTHIEFLYYS